MMPINTHIEEKSVVFRTNFAVCLFWFSSYASLHRSQFQWYDNNHSRAMQRIKEVTHRYD